MYFIFSKEKFVSYIVAFSTVAILFTISLVQDKNETIQTSVNARFKIIEISIAKNAEKCPVGWLQEKTRNS